MLKKYDILKAHIQADKRHYEKLAKESDNPLFAGAYAIYRELESYVKTLDEVWKDE